MKVESFPEEKTKTLFNGTVDDAKLSYPTGFGICNANAKKLQTALKYSGAYIGNK